MEVCRLLVSVGCFAYFIPLTATYRLPGLMVRRARQSGSCGENEYPNGNICCLNCESGTSLKSACTTSGQKGTCEECALGTFTEHDNHLTKCVDCAKCGPDQEVAEPCTNTQNTKCRCKAGRFCNPDEACEVCRKCLTCKSDERTVRNCTSTSDTVCKKIHPKTETSSDATVIASIVVVAVVLLVAGVIFAIYKKKYGCRGPSGASPKVPQTDYGRNGSIPLISVSLQEEEELPTLIPVNGEQSLRSCFEFFEELDVDFHKKFFRRLEFTDNAIKSKEGLPYDDRIHELLNSWVEREGKKASLNELLRVLVDLNQRRTAEKIMKVLDNGQYYTESKDIL
ncbi:Tumor necrosis factor receptor superfamily member 22 [Oryzias melastigma]|uniref:Tumor necrosis factor receptor superfamily member 22 n=1 Tax=Oryzias melastigma TaxID=30732 RepID=A0A834CEX8_ORYME|nr:Tumor necrosis factor receptor superfamily member 22 [Oryzias melastigma]